MFVKIILLQLTGNHKKLFNKRLLKVSKKIIQKTESRTKHPPRVIKDS